jgi:hypothetical protein
MAEQLPHRNMQEQSGKSPANGSPSLSLSSNSSSSTTPAHPSSCASDYSKSLLDTRTLRKSRKSLTKLADKVESRIMCRIIAESDGHLSQAQAAFGGLTLDMAALDRAGTIENNYRSPAPSPGLTAEILEVSRMHQISRDNRLMPGSPTESPYGVALGSQATLSTTRHARLSDYNASKYPLSPVFEQPNEASNSTPLRHSLQDVRSPASESPRGSHWGSH